MEKIVFLDESFCTSLLANLKKYIADNIKVYIDREQTILRVVIYEIPGRHPLEWNYAYVWDDLYYRIIKDETFISLLTKEIVEEYKKYLLDTYVNKHFKFKIKS